MRAGPVQLKAGWNRFGIGSYDDWYKKNRTIFTLIHKQTDALAALIWLGPKPLGKKFPRTGKEEKYEAADDWHTVSWRSYPGFRGRGMMKNFTKFVMDTYREKFPKMKLWFITEDVNKAMQKLGSELGFEKEEAMSELVPGSIVMIKLEGPYIRYHRSSIIAH